MFYLAISFFINNTEEFYDNNRKLIYEYWKNTISYLKNFYQTDNQNNLENDIETYVEKIKENTNYAEYIEINMMAEFLNINNICYSLYNAQYTLKAVYFGNEKIM